MISSLASLKKDPIVFICLCIVYLFSWLQFTLVGNAYFADFITIALMLFLTVSSPFFHRVIKDYKKSLFFMLIMTFLFLVFDFYNGIHSSDYLRGLSRNGIFVLNVFLALYFLHTYGFYSATILFVIIALSNPLWNYLGVIPLSLTTGSLIGFFKYFGGIYLLLIIFLLKPLKPVIKVICAGLFAIYVLKYAEFRSGALFCAVPVLAYLTDLIFGIRRFLALGFLLISIPLLLLFSNYYFLNSEFFDSDTINRRIASNEQRYDIFLFSWNEFVERPLSGYGTWQNAERYVNADDSSLYISVHSMIMQYGFEYGILGMLFVFWILAITVYSCVKVLLYNHPRDKQDMNNKLMFFFVVSIQAFNIFMGGLGGYGRFTVAWVFAMTLFSIYRNGQLSESKDKHWESKNKGSSKSNMFMRNRSGFLYYRKPV